MDPLSALSLGCNILDLVGKAISCGRVVKQIYDSADGLQKAHETVGIQADRLKEVVDFLEKKQSEMAAAEDEKIKEITDRCVQASAQLHGVLDDCKAKGTNFRIYAASKAALKSFLNRDKIVAFQEELKNCQTDLHSFVGIAIHGDVAKILRNLERAGIGEKSELMTSLSKMKDRLRDAMVGPVDGQRTFQEALDMVKDGTILEALHSEILHQRFRDVRDEYPGTFKWIFEDPAFVRQLEPELAISFPDWLQRGDGIFHIAGKPGSGKSTLMKYLCGHEKTETLLEKWAQDGHRQLLLAKFFFWRIGVSHEQKSMNGLIRGLLYEILCAAPPLARVLFPQHWKRASQNVRGLQRIQILPDEIMTAFSRLVKSSASLDQMGPLGKIRVCLFIDGLDEFEDALGGRLMTHGRLAELLRSWAQDSSGNIKICASSRIEAPFMDNFSITQRLTLNNVTTQDIGRVVKSVLGEHEKFQLLRAAHETECEKLLQNIIDTADGVFLWVALLLKDLCQGLERWDTLDVLEERVSLAPPDLDDFLGQILQRIDRVHRNGVYLLLAVVLRTTGTVLSTEPREAECAFFDTLDFPYGWYRQLGFNLSVLSCFAILWTSRKGIRMDANVELCDLNFPNIDSSAWSATIRERCNGLLDVLEGGYVRFMHRSIPEFLHKHFNRQQESYALDDFKVTEAMVWAYLVEAKYVAARNSSGQATESQAATSNPPPFVYRDSGIGSEYEFGEGDQDQPAASDGRITRDTVDDLSDISADDSRGNSEAMTLKKSARGRENWQPRPRMSGELFGFLCRVRQIKLEKEDACQLIFRLLLSIEDTMHKNPEQWPAQSRILMTVSDVQDQSWSLLYQSILVGLHEFIGWTFRQPQVVTCHENLFNMAHSAVESFFESSGTPFSVLMLEVLFVDAVKTDIVFPPGDSFRRLYHTKAAGLHGKPLWHAFLLNLPYYFNFSSPVMWQAIEVWLKRGANAQACLQFRLTNPRHGDVVALDARDRSGAIQLHDMSNVVAYSWELDNFIRKLERQRGKLCYPTTLELGLRDLVTLMQPPNELELLELIDARTLDEAHAGKSVPDKLLADQEVSCLY